MSVKAYSYLDTLKQFCIQSFSYQNKLISEKYPGDRSPLFDLVCDLQVLHATA